MSPQGFQRRSAMLLPRFSGTPCTGAVSMRLATKGTRWPKPGACGFPYQPYRQRQCSPVWVRRRRVGQGASIDHVRPHLRYVAWPRGHGRGWAAVVATREEAVVAGNAAGRSVATGKDARGSSTLRALPRPPTSAATPPASGTAANTADGVWQCRGRRRRRARNRQARTVTCAVKSEAAAQAGRWRRRSSRCPQSPPGRLV